MASEIATRHRIVPYDPAWPPDDTEESVVGTNLHQATIVNVRWGLNEVAKLLAMRGGALPWEALSQTIITGFVRRSGKRYKTLPDVFVYRQHIDPSRGSLSVGLDGPPALIVEVLSDSTYESDLNIRSGKGYSYARAGVREYLTLDPSGLYLREGGRAWRLVEGAYRPWEPDADGRWHSSELAVAIGLEGALATVYTREGRPIPHEGEVAAALAQHDQELRQRDQELRQRDDEIARQAAELQRLRRLLGPHD